MQLFAQQPTTFEWPTEALGKLIFDRFQFFLDIWVEHDRPRHDCHGVVDEGICDLLTRFGQLPSVPEGVVT